MLAKVDKEIPLKIPNLATGTMPNQKIMSHNKKTFDSMVKARATELNNVLDSFEWDSLGEVDWVSCGVYLLLPQVPVGDDPPEHIYAKVQCKFLQGEVAEAPIR